MLTQPSISQELEAWVFHLCEFVCFGNHGVLYVAANEQLCVDGSNATLECAIQIAEDSFGDALVPVILDALNDFGLRLRSGVTVRAVRNEFVRAFRDYGAAAAVQRRAGTKRIGRLPITTTVGTIFDAATEPDPKGTPSAGRFALSMN